MHIQTAINNNQPREAHRLVHTLKGLSATIGAMSLHRAVKNLEKAMKKGRTDVIDMLSVLDQHLQTVVAQINESTGQRTAEKKDEMKQLTRQDLDAVVMPQLMQLKDLMAARQEAEDEEQGLSLGAADYITKPIKPPVVQARIQAHMKLHMYRRHLEDLVSQRAEQLRKGDIETVHRLTRASEYKDEDTGTHIKRISYYTRQLAETMGMDASFCETIFYASPMHDIGKVGIPDSVLCKQGSLTHKIMKTHSGNGPTNRGLTMKKP